MKPLLKSQKNEIFQALKEGGLTESDIAQIKWEEIEIEKEKEKLIKLSIQVENFNFYFEFYNYPEGEINYYPDNGGGVYFSSSIPSRIQDWASNVKKEMEAPDLWGDLNKIHASFSFDEEAINENEAIIAREATHIREKLVILETRLIQNYGSSEAIQKTIQHNFKYLNANIEKQGKKDWLHTFIGVMASLAIAVGISAVNADGFWGLIKETVGNPINLFLGN